MKRSFLFILPAIVAFVALTAAAIQTAETCDQNALKAKAKAALDPFKYDSGKVTRIYYRKKAQVKEIEVPVFVGEKYRFVFNSEAVTRDVTITVYNKDKDSKNRKALFTMKALDGNRVQTFDPDGARMHFFVDYDIPATNDSLPPADCLVMMLGYK
ncbi:MAG TPA: hypothetical protein VFU15_15875 [Bacteroidia bacterium]|nr:hypothetical protein [Bacteroidia bacterium]